MRVALFAALAVVACAAGQLTPQVAESEASALASTGRSDLEVIIECEGVPCIGVYEDAAFVDLLCGCFRHSAPNGTYSLQFGAVKAEADPEAPGKPVE